jgi:hypothetical protein
VSAGPDGPGITVFEGDFRVMICGMQVYYCISHYLTYLPPLSSKKGCRKSPDAEWKDIKMINKPSAFVDYRQSGVYRVDGDYRLAVSSYIRLHLLDYLGRPRLVVGYNDYSG